MEAGLESDISQINLQIHGDSTQTAPPFEEFSLQSHPMTQCLLLAIFCRFQDLDITTANGR
jgi:hypothetical protein